MTRHSPPRVFLSYTHDSEPHRGAVLGLADDLRAGGVDAWIDRYEPAPSVGWPRWMLEQVDRADAVLVVCSRVLRQRYEGQAPPGKGRGGAFEGLLALQHVYDAQGRNSVFIPVLLGEEPEGSIPRFLRPYTHYRLPSEYHSLVRRLLGSPPVRPPTLAPTPGSDGGEDNRPLAPAKVRSAGMRFAVAVAPLEHDPSGQNRRLIIDALEPLSGIEVLAPEVVLETGGPKPQEAVSAAHERAQRCLVEMGASVMIWGTVLTGDLLRLRWTLSDELVTPASTDRYTRDELDISRSLGGALADVLRLLVLVISAGFEERFGHYLVESLEPFARKVRAILSQEEISGRWSARQRSTILELLGGALQVLGEQTGDRARFTEGISVLTEAVGCIGQVGGRSAFALLLRGNMFVRLGQGTPQTADLRLGLEDYRAALRHYKTGEHRGGQALVLTNMGVVLRLLGERDGDERLLEEAVSVLRVALDNVAHSESPLLWALAHDGLGNALRLTSAYRTSGASLREAVEHYSKALTVFSRERSPLHWAGTMTNLGATFATLGERSPDRRELEEAEHTLRLALQEQSREKVPLDWALTQDTLGHVLVNLSKRRPDGRADLEAARTALESAASQRLASGFLSEAAATEATLAACLIQLTAPPTEAEEEKLLLRQAIATADRASQRIGREAGPELWASAKNISGLARKHLSLAEQSPEEAIQAIADFRSALEERAEDRTPLSWAQTKRNLGSALADTAPLRKDPSGVHEGLRELRDALRVLTPDETRDDWLSTQAELGRLLAIVDPPSAPSALRAAIEVLGDSNPTRTVHLRSLLAHVLCNLGEKELKGELWAEAFRTLSAPLPGPVGPIEPRVARGMAFDLGRSAQGIGYSTGKVEALQLALKMFSNVIAEIDRDHDVPGWVDCQRRISLTHYFLAGYDPTRDNIESAIRTLEESLKHWTRESVPSMWATIQMQLAAVFMLRGRQGDRPGESQTEAIRLCEEVVAGGEPVGEAAEAARRMLELAREALEASSSEDNLA